jgi:hypothetical protein
VDGLGERHRRQGRAVGDDHDDDDDRRYDHHPVSLPLALTLEEASR